MRKSIGVRHACNIGDLIASLAGLKGYWEMTGDKFDYLQELNVIGIYHDNYYHPTQDNGNQVMCNKSMFDMIRPLIECQPYINTFDEYVGQKIIVDFSKVRGTIDVNMPQGSLQAWYMLAFPDLAFDLSRAWIEVPDAQIPDEFKGKVMVNFTNRYRNQFIQYYFLKEYESDLLFAGTEYEYYEFCKKWGLNMPLLKVDNFLTLAQIMKQSKFLLGNQSFCWNLNRAMNLPSILELFKHAHNCMPFYGNNNYGYFHQNAVEYYFKKLIS